MLHALEVKTHTYLITMREIDQEAVVVTLAAPKPMAAVVEGHAGNDSQVDAFVVGKALAHGFEYVKGATTQTVGAMIDAQLHLAFAGHHGQHHGLALAVERVYEPMCVHLIGQ